MCLKPHEDHFVLGQGPTTISHRLIGIIGIIGMIGIIGAIGITGMLKYIYIYRERCIYIYIHRERDIYAVVS